LPNDSVRSVSARLGCGFGWHDASPRPGFVPPLLYSLAHHTPTAFLDITSGNNSVFSGVSCCSAGGGYDMASGLGSPLADEIATRLHH
jgi:hypothetical protein